MKESIDVVGGLVTPAAQDGIAAGTLAPACGRCRTERGMVSAEWAVGIIAAIAIAGVLLSVVTSGPVESAILKFILLVIKHFAVGLG
ncbi:DUF4244 domain-containing protein [uncultured Friedmanniella sp.]|uniref:DUF4244 domain-containing protein n=1 Tax=uncultured Friedmanniella sp. TaxID=335381 RepID=UPI0035CA5A7F